MIKEKPTIELYKFFQQAYDHFNDRLFNGKLPDVIITMQRKNNVMGYLSINRWNGEGDDETISELALNPAYFAVEPLIEVLQTTVHEQVHLWQEIYGTTSNRNYHNRQFADKMIKIGLMPTATGKPGGRQTGQKMNDYPLEGGLFEKTSIELMEKGWKLPFVDRIIKTENKKEDEKEPSTVTLRQSSIASGRKNSKHKPSKKNIKTMLETPVRELFPNIVDTGTLRDTKKHNKSAYYCYHCKIKVWGRPRLNLICAEDKCGRRYMEIFE